MTTLIDTRLAQFRITAKLGEGGMGAVYRAEDTKLGREVAIKVLPEEFTANAERLARFEREAKLLASLNHPNIGAIYDFAREGDVHFLVLELAEGEDLAQRLGRGRIPIEEAMPIAIQIAEALEAAHARGIIHRDLKPANVKLTPAGKVKVLDFGLAKAWDAPGGDSGSLSLSPTLTAQVTREGVILGTAAYMSPEQARGLDVDKRSDIWAFGVLLYEVLSGRQAFPGATVSDVLAGVLKESVDLEALPHDTPWRLRALLERCLQKDPKQRLHDVADARLEFEEIVAHPDEAPPTAVGAPARAPIWLWGLAGLLLVSTIVLGWRAFNLPPAFAPTTARFATTLSRALHFEVGGEVFIDVAPDGSALAFAVSDGKTSSLYLRRLSELEPTRIPGTEGGRDMYFSPDGRWLAFALNGKLAKIPLTGGTPVILSDATWGRGTWGDDGSIVFSRAYNRGLSLISQDGGEVTELTTPDFEIGELNHSAPELLPGGKVVLFNSFRLPVSKTRIEGLRIDTGERKTIVENAADARYLSTGHLLFVRGDRLMAARFDAESLEILGPHVQVLSDFPLDSYTAHSQYSVSDTGTLVYVPLSVIQAAARLVWIDREGRVEALSIEPRAFETLSLSPDDRHAVTTIWGESRDLWTADLERGVLTRLTFGEGSELNGFYTPDGQRVVYMHDQPAFDLFAVKADASAEPVELYSSLDDKFLSGISPDGRFAIYFESVSGSVEGGDIDLAVVPLDGEGDPVKVRSSPFIESFASFSPDGRWIAFASDEGGRFEIYAQPFPGPGGKQQISPEGGGFPLWGRNGEIFYRDGDRMMAVEVETGDRLEIGRPKLLFEYPLGATDFTRLYDVTADGQRFLVKEVSEEGRPRQANVVLNWFSELEELVP